jgi:hypothetical protein
MPTETDGPSASLVPVDFSKDAVSKAVFVKVASSSLVTVPVALGGVGVVAVLAISAPLWVAAPLLIGIGVFGINYFLRRDVETENYLKAIRNLQRKLIAEMPGRLQESLKVAGSQRGLKQLEELEKSFEDFQELLERKFSRRGMTLNRFLGTAEQVRAGALYKLQMVLDQMKAIESIPADLEKQIRTRGANDNQVRLIHERASHREQALETIERLHTDVEESLTRLSEISVRIANVGIDEDEGATFESYLGELQALASQASTFHKET